MKHWYVLCLVLITPVCSASVSRLPLRHTLSIAPAYWQGYSQYEIGYRDELFPISRLSKPLKSAGISGQYALSNQTKTHPWSWKLQLSGLFFGSAHTGDMIDSDFLDINEPDRLAYYSESDTQQNWGKIVDFLWLRRFPNSPVSIGLGYRTTEWDLLISNVEQTNFVEAILVEATGKTEYRYLDVPQTVSASGPVMTYTARHDMTYLSLHYTGSIKKAGISLMLGYAPRATMTDVDDHLLRGKRVFGEASGTATLYDCELTYPILSQATDTYQVAWFASAQGYRSDLYGRQKQVFYQDSTQAPLYIDYQSELQLSIFSLGIRVETL